MRWFRLVDWPNNDPLWDEDDLTLRERVAGRVDAAYDGSWLARMWWDVQHPPKWMDWIPPWRRHGRRCGDRFEHASRELLAGGDAETWQRATSGITYCSTCDYWHLTPRNPVFWLVVIFGEH